ncbi:hypothetical protein FUAX_28520 [Fulvitalea axinellae]|uniref:RDD domain-containing protein n=1 Tax=Fulvitalea axinellae TaxID=1182444 RepID=A0AAU9DH70_9BACT|nr:hypothetical protein FUAX_28520 [Fulvitalea axinellae]
MKKIDIRTTQNVTIEYPLASTMDRVLAYGLDLIIITACTSILSLSSALIFRGSPVMEYIIGFIILLFIFAYHLNMELFFGGRSFGKKIMKLRVVKINGMRVSVYDYFLRWAFRIFDCMLSIGFLGILSVSSSRNKQRLGDLMANTTVVKDSEDHYVNLKDLTSLKSGESYTAKYPEITRLTEADMLLVKEVLDRVQDNKSQASTDVINLTVEKVTEATGLKAPANKVDFLRICLKDFVYLTR